MIDTKLIGVAKTLNNKLNRLARGYESSLDFAYGYISALLQMGYINKKQANILKKCYATEEEYYFDDKSGEAIRCQE